jgi:hypothetical protein
MYFVPQFISLSHFVFQYRMKGDEDNDDEEISAKDHVDGNCDDGNSAYTDQESPVLAGQ